MNDAEIKALLERRISRRRAKDLLVALIKVPSPQTELLEDEPRLKAFITSAIEPRLRTMGFSDIRYDPVGNLIATYGAGASGKSLMLIGNAMNQPAATMPNPYDGDVVDGAAYGLPGECVMGKGASEQKANLAAMLHAMETVIASEIPINGQLIFTCCVSGETGKHDAIKSVVEGAAVRADPRPHRRVRHGEGLALPFVAALGRGQRHHRRDRGDPAAAGQGEGGQDPSATGQTIVDGQSHSQLSRVDPHGAGTLRVHPRPTPAAGRGSE
jgi:hypothetical protein